MWLAGINADINLGGKSAFINVGWYDLVPDLFSKVFGVMGRVEAWKGRWGLFVDNYFTYMAGDASAEAGKQIFLGPLPRPRVLVLSGDAKFIARAGNTDFGLRYLVGTVPLNQSGKPLPVMSFEVLGGGRVNWYNQYVKFNLAGTFDGPFFTATRGRTISSSRSRAYVEPFLGFRLGFWLTEKALITFRGTVGGFGFMNDNNLDGDMELNFGYRVHRNIYAYLGYRARYDQFSKNEFSFNGWIHGPVLGAVFAY
jgi:hypothetical protein